MGAQRERYVKLAPLDIDMETAIARMFQSFFAPGSYRAVCEVIGKSPAKNQILPMTSADFLNYLDKTQLLPESADKYIYHIRHLLGRMAASNLLVEMGSASQNAMIPKSYYALAELTCRQSAGVMWLAKVLGGRFVHRQVSPAVVHIVGETPQGHAAAGSGVIFDDHHILTCGHVVSRMEVARTQRFQGKEVIVEEKNIFRHQLLDLAVIQVEQPLMIARGLAFLAPAIAQRVYTFGYPKIPNVRPRHLDSDDSYLIMQSGEVTNESVIASNQTELFLFSAISRPGNSGGPIISEDGYVVGISTELTHGRYENENVFAPHYAGIPSQVAANAVNELEVDAEIPYETFD